MTLSTIATTCLRNRRNVVYKLITEATFGSQDVYQRKWITGHSGNILGRESTDWTPSSEQTDHLNTQQIGFDMYEVIEYNIHFVIMHSYKVKTTFCTNIYGFTRPNTCQASTVVVSVHIPHRDWFR